jgi:hypothetical protein
MKSYTKRRKPRAKKGGSSLNSSEITAANNVQNTPSFQGLPIRYFYDMNDYNSDPNNPAVITNARLSGGKSRRVKKSKKSKKTSRKSKKNGRRQRGGFNVFSNTPLLGTASYNVPASFGSVPFAFISKDFIAGDITPLHPQNPSTIQQPAEAKYNAYNPPLA